MLQSWLAVDCHCHRFCRWISTLGSFQDLFSKPNQAANVMNFKNENHNVIRWLLTRLLLLKFVRYLQFASVMVFELGLRPVA